MWLIMLAYFFGFFVGYAIDGALGGSGQPSYNLVGRYLGPDGVRIAYAFGAALAIVGFLIRWWASSYLAGVVMDSALHGDRLTVSGPYCYVRNPLYLGSLLQAIAIGALAPPPGLILVVGLMLVVIYRLIMLEESYLRATQGQPYRDFCAAVPRLLPRLTPLHQPIGEKANLLRGLWIELGTLGFAITISYAAIALPERRDPTIYILLYGSILLLFVSATISRRLAPAPNGR